MSKASKAHSAALAFPAAPSAALAPVPYPSPFPYALGRPGKAGKPAKPQHTLKKGAVNALVGVAATAAVRTLGNTYEHLTGKSPALIEGVAGAAGVLVFERQSIPGQIADKTLTDATTRVADVGSKSILDMLFPKRDDDGVKTSMK